MLAPDRPAMWQFFDDGMFISFNEIPQENLTLENLCRFYAEAVAFVGELVSELCGGEEIFTLKAQISADSAPVLLCGKEKFPAGNNNEISGEISRSAADIASGRENHAVRLIRRIGENFKLPDRMLDRMEPAIKDFLERR